MDLNEFEMAILIAAVDAEEANTDADSAASEAATRLDPEPHRYHIALQRLDEDGYVDARMNRGDNRLMSAHLVSVRPKGVDAVRRQREASSVMLSQADRLAVEIVLTHLAQDLESDEVNSLDADDRADLQAQVATIDAQYRSPRARRRIVLEALKSIRSILESLAGSAALLGVIELINRLSQ